MKRAIRILLIIALIIGLIYIAYKAVDATAHAVDRTEHDTVMEIGRDAINHYKYDEYKRNQAISSECQLPRPTANALEVGACKSSN